MVEERNLNESENQIYDGISAAELQFVLQGYLLNYLRDDYKSDGEYVLPLRVSLHLPHNSNRALTKNAHVEISENGEE